jgi:hypothetical protein
VRFASISRRIFSNSSSVGSEFWRFPPFFAIFGPFLAVFWPFLAYFCSIFATESRKSRLARRRIFAESEATSAAFSELSPFSGVFWSFLVVFWPVLDVFGAFLAAFEPFLAVFEAFLAVFGRFSAREAPIFGKSGASSEEISEPEASFSGAPRPSLVAS